MTVEQRLANIEKNQERTNALLHKLLGNVPDQVKGWGTYEDATKILNRSKMWYKIARNGKGYAKSKGNQNLVEGSDWRKVGGEIEYYLPSIQNLKESITKNKKLTGQTVSL